MRWRNPKAAALTAQQAAIVDTLRGGAWMTSREIASAIGTDAGLKSIHVQVHCIRAAGVAIESEGGPYSRGYRIVQA